MYEENPNAFSVSYGDGSVEPGMTLRDYFAGKAMQALVAGKVGGDMSADVIRCIAEDAYDIAEALLREREE